MGKHQHLPDTKQFGDYLLDDLARFSGDTHAHCKLKRQKITTLSA
jgi:hypothetical protein